LAARGPAPEEAARRFEQLVFARLDRNEPFTEAMLAGYQAFLCSDLFLYLREPNDNFAVADRLSHFLTNSRPDAQLLGSLAGLTGRAALAAAYATASGARGGVPSAVAQSGPALLAFAAFGGPSDSLANLEDIAERTAASLSDDARRGIRARWIMRAALLAFPDYKMRALSVAARSGSDRDPQTTLAAALTGDADALRRRLSAMARTRANFRPADIKMEGLFLGASALASIGDTQTAIDWLDPTLRTLRLSASRNLANVVATGPLVRAMALRAKLADRVGDRATARTWGRAVLILWSDADAFLQPAVEEIRRLTH
jgi:hypothetical protein